jgi:TolA-binding protein
VLFACAISHGESPRDQYKVAATHYAAGRWELAAAEFQEFVDRFPQHANTSSAVFYLGESLMQLRQFQKAGNAFQRVVVQHPTDSRSDRALFRWGEALMLAGDDVAARRLLEQFHDRYPEQQLNEIALYYLGNLAAKQFDPRAIDHYAELLDSFPDTRYAAEARLQLGIQYYRHDDLGSAMTQFGLVETNYPLTNTHASIDLRVRSRYWMGVTQLARKDYAHAAKTLQSVEAIAPQHSLAAAANRFASARNWTKPIGPTAKSCETTKTANGRTMLS